MKHLISLGCLLAVTLLTTPANASAAEPTFLADVAPILVSRCTSCHGGLKARGGYKLNTFDNLLKQGKSETNPIVPGKPEESELYRRLVATDESERMPPGDDPLAKEEIALVKNWILAGAKYDGSDRLASLKAILPPRKHPVSPEKYPAPAPVFALAFSPDGKELAVGGVNEVTLWDPTNGKLLRRLQHLPARIHAISYSPDGNHLLVGGGTAGEYGEVALVDVRSGAKVRVFGTFDDVVLAVAFASDGKTIAAGSADNTSRAYKIEEGKEVWRSALHSDWITGVAFSPDGKWVVTASKDRTVKVLEATTGKLFTTFNGHRRQYSPHAGQFEVYAVAFAPSGNVFSAGAGTAIRAWDVLKTKDENGSAADMEERFKNAGHTRYFDYNATKPVFGLAVSAGHVFSAGGDGLIRQHDATSGKQTREYTGHADWVYALTVNEATNRIASGGFDGEVRVWDIQSGTPVTTFKAAPGWTK